MGADIYLYSVYNENSAKYNKKFENAVKLRNKHEANGKDDLAERAQKKVMKYYNLMYSEGYFRDSYNGTNMLNKLGLSWWNDVVPMLDREGNLKGSKLKKFLIMITNRELSLPTKEDLIADHCTVDDDKNSIDVWHQMFIDNHQELIKLVKLAIELNEPLYCSL